MYIKLNDSSRINDNGHAFTIRPTVSEIQDPKRPAIISNGVIEISQFGPVDPQLTVCVDRSLKVSDLQINSVDTCTAEVDDTGLLPVADSLSYHFDNKYISHMNLPYENTDYYSMLFGSMDRDENGHVS